MHHLASPWRAWAWSLAACAAACSQGAAPAKTIADASFALLGGLDAAAPADTDATPPDSAAAADSPQLAELNLSDAALDATPDAVSDAEPDAEPDALVDAVPDVAADALDSAGLPETAVADAPTADADSGPEAETDPQPDAEAPTDAEADSDAESAADSGSDAVVDVWVAPEGGNPSTGCFGKDGTVACSLDGKFRVECIDGAWTAIQHCGFGVCTVSLANGGAVLTTCGVPKTKLIELSSACARYNTCFGPVSHEVCVRANLSPVAFAAGFGSGAMSKVAGIAFAEIGNNLTCAGKAKTCAALAECLYYFAINKCATSAIGCENDVAYTCTGSVALATNCKKFGMFCAEGATAQCFKGAPCKPSDPPKCDGQVWQACVPVTSDSGYLTSVDCEAAPGSCNSKTTVLASACSNAALAPCTMATTAPVCAKNAKVICQGSETVTTPCPPGMQCAVEDQFGLFNAECPDSQSCAKALCTEGGACAMQAKCNGSEVWFCQAKQPVSFDCKTLGLGCAMTAAGPACQ